MSPTASDPRTVVTDMWQTRPTRRETDRKIAGVAAALARRYDVDPVLVRIGFVVSAFCGVGIALYLAAWVSLPPDFNDPPRGNLQRNQATRVLLYLGLALATLHAVHQLATGQVDFLVGLLVVGGLLYLLQVTRGEHRADVAHAGSTGPAPGTAAGPAPVPFVPAEPRTPREPRSRLTPVTVALALLAAGITGVVMLAGDIGFPGSRAVVAVPLAVIGIGLLIGSFTRGGRGLVLIALPLMLVGFVINWAPTHQWRGAGDLEVAPASVSAVAPAYEQTFGDVELDLRHLDLTTVPGAPVPAPPPAPAAPPIGGGATVPAPGPAAPNPAPNPAPNAAAPGAAVGEPVRTRVTVQFGEVLILLPPNADVQVHCHASIGEVDCLGDKGARYGATEDDGPTADAVVHNLGDDAVAGGRPLEIDVNVGTGSVEVRRG